MEQATSNETPIRYQAFNWNSRMWVHESPQHTGGFEWAAYEWGVNHPEYPDIRDGIYIEIVHYGDCPMTPASRTNKSRIAQCRFLVTKHLSIPSKARPQYGETTMVHSLDEGLRDAELWLATATKRLEPHIRAIKALSFNGGIEA